MHVLQMKSLIDSDMRNPAGALRLLFATEAYGMGIDVLDIRKIVHIGPPSNLESMYSKTCPYVMQTDVKLLKLVH